ncbi:thermonuclease family protein [Microbacterium sp. TPU 3598]|uniref:thermonuclease family protein n=1 Tax=Microbacterium sp. TPU 3598 TaxID=1938334 RepID=UPI0012FE36D8|nr:thermonuclease family protein [Microbacterium sp. TPU 3598]
MTGNTLEVMQAMILMGAICVFCVFAIEVIRVVRGSSDRVWLLWALFGLLLVVSALFFLTTFNQSTSTNDSEAEEPTESGEVVAVIDGDTFDVQLPEGRARVRIIGIDTPEIAHQTGEADECYAQPARVFLDALIYRRTVTLQADPTQADTDKYGRLLRHVDYDGLNVALAALKAGTGGEYTYDVPYAGQADYVAAMELARETGEGLWGKCDPDGG